jgi:hypothetical protein
MNNYRGIARKNIIKASDAVPAMFSAKEYCKQHTGQQQKPKN